MSEHSEPAYVKKRKEAEKKERDRQQHEDNVKIINALNSVSHQLETRIERDDTEYQKRGRREIITILLIFLTVALSLLGDDIFNQTMIHADAAAKGQIDALNKQLAEAKRQADAAEKQSGIAQTAFEEGIRAVIATKGLTWGDPLKRDADNVVSINFANVGKEATAVYGTIPEIAYNKDSTKKFGVDSIDMGINTKCDFSNYSPGIIPSFPDNTVSNNLPVKVDKATVNDVLDGATTIAVRGCLFYTEFGTTHYTGYCYIAAQGTQTASLAKSPLCFSGNFAR
jgi:hypothetical protein